jgi:hypothetical protein
VDDVEVFGDQQEQQPARQPQQGPPEQIGVKVVAEPVGDGSPASMASACQRSIRQADGRAPSGTS